MSESMGVNLKMTNYVHFCISANLFIYQTLWIKNEKNL